jgi:hypothetical protein
MTKRIYKFAGKLGRPCRDLLQGVYFQLEGFIDLSHY